MRRCYRKVARAGSFWGLWRTLPSANRWKSSSGNQKLESLGVLAGGIAHDFNNLLTGILGNASLGLDLAPPDSPLRPLLLRLMKASERAADLTRQLLAYAGKGRFVLSALSLTAAAQEISSLVRAT